MLAAVTDRVLAAWPSLDLGGRRPSALHYLGLPGAPEGGTTTFLAFAEHRPHPLAAVKVYRAPDAGPRARGEAAILDYLSRVPEMRRSVPRVLFCDCVDGCWTIAQTVVAGRPMRVELGADGLPDRRATEVQFTAVCDWLARLQRSGCPEAIGAPAGQSRALGTLAEFERLFGPSVIDERFFEELRAWAATLPARRAFLAHGDLCRQNVLEGGAGGSAGLAVVDWTDADGADLPWCDLFFFLSTFFIQARRTTGLQGILDAVFATFARPVHPYADLVRQVVLGHCRALDIAPRLRLLLGLFFADQAMREAGKLARLTRTSGLPRITLWLADETGMPLAQARHASFWVSLFKELPRRMKDDPW